jgi:hypothetical protein
MWTRDPRGECRDSLGADDGTRTHDPHVGNVALYQLSYVRDVPPVYEPGSGSAPIARGFP